MESPLREVPLYNYQYARLTSVLHSPSGDLPVHQTLAYGEKNVLTFLCNHFTNPHNIPDALLDGVTAVVLQV